MKPAAILLVMLLLTIPYAATATTLGFQRPTITGLAYPTPFNYTVFSANLTNTSFVVANISFSRLDLLVNNVYKNNSAVNTITSSVTNASATQSFLIVNATNTSQLFSSGATLASLFDIQWKYVNLTSANTDPIIFDTSYSQWYGNTSTPDTGFHTFTHLNNGNITGAIPTGFVPQDIWMNGQYTYTFTVTDSSTGAPISGVAISDSGSRTNTTGTNGVASLTEPFGAVVVYFTATGYSGRAISYIVDSDATIAVMLTAAPATPVQNTNTIWTVHQVVFQFIDANSNPIIGGYSSAQAIESTIPGGLAGGLSFFETAYGVSASVASVMLSNNLTMNATTDDSGSIVYMLVPTIEYNINITDSSGNVFTKTIFPLDSYYQIKTTTAANMSQADLALSNQNIYNGQSIFIANFTEPNSSYGTMNNYVYDATGHTGGANCWFTCVDNGTTWWDNQSWAYGAGVQIINKTVPIVAYQQWGWGCETV